MRAKWIHIYTYRGCHLSASEADMKRAADTVGLRFLNIVGFGSPSPKVFGGPHSGMLVAQGELPDGKMVHIKLRVTDELSAHKISKL